NLYTGKTYNSVENIAQFFSERGMAPPSGLTKRPEPPPSSPKASGREGSVPPVKQVSSPPVRPPQKSSRPLGQAGAKSGMTIQHPKYGRGTVLRREGDGEDAKLTISFPGYGLKKIVEKYAGIKIQE
ncbi:MAG: hypothetical protein JO185_25580, partial [Acidobacteriaceae bacterium]|nr:hypothetical protein [Acidobacteriaceae bacterium]